MRIARRLLRFAFVLAAASAGAIGAVAAIAACGTSSAGPGGSDAAAQPPPPFDAAIPAPGTATVTGTGGFPGGSARFATDLTGGCNSTDDAGIPAHLVILISSQGLPSVLCPDAGAPTTGPGDWLDIEIATNQIVQRQPITQGIAPGTYVIGNENQNDPDVCMLPDGTNAFAQLLVPGGTNAQELSMSGTVTLDTVSPTSVTGSFSLVMGDPYGRTDASPPPAISGAFNATTCP
jgi:hypothetical protein